MPQVTVINPTAHIENSRLRIAAYCRVSSDSDDQLESFANQVDYYTSLIGSNTTWELAGIYADAGLTGTRSDTRPDFQRLLRDCRRGKIDKVITKSISRFSRNTKDCLTSIRELKALGVEVFFEKEKLDTSSLSGEILLGFYGTLAQEESVSISGNMRWSYERRMRSGKFITCRAPYGYRLENGTLIVNPDEGLVVRRIFNEYLSGRSVTHIAADLASECIPKRNGRWVPNTIRGILANEKYAGNVLLQKRYTTDTLPYKLVRNYGERDQYYIEHSHAPIISKDTFDKAQKLKQARSSDASPILPDTYAFSKRILCGECGHGFKRRVCNQKTYWVCYNHFSDSRACPVKQISEQSIEAAFVRMWNKLRAKQAEILRPVLSGLEQLRAQAIRKNKWIYEIENGINELTEQNRVLNRLHRQGYIDSAIFMEKSGELRHRIGDLLQKRRRCLEDDEDTSLDDTRRLMEALEAGPECIQSFDSALFEDIVCKIIATSGDEIRFRLINGMELTEAIKRGR